MGPARFHCATLLTDDTLKYFATYTSVIFLLKMALIQLGVPANFRQNNTKPRIVLCAVIGGNRNFDFRP